MRLSPVSPVRSMSPAATPTPTGGVPGHDVRAPSLPPYCLVRMDGSVVDLSGLVPMDSVDDGLFGLELAMACDRELRGEREPKAVCDACGQNCGGWCARHPGHVSAGDTE